MAAIDTKDIYKGKPNPFKEAAKGAKTLLTEMEKLIVKGKEVSDALKLDIQANKKQNSADLKKLTDQTSKLSTATKAGNEIIKEKQRLEVTLKKLNSDKIQQNEQLKVQVQLQRKNNKELARDQLKLINSFEKLTKKTNEAQRRFKNLATQFGVNSKQAKAAKVEFEKLDNRLSKVNKAARDGRRDVGQYSKGWAGLKKLFVGGLGILGVTAGFSAIRSGVTKLVTTFSDFQRQVSKVGAISGASGDDLKALTAQAQALGEATEKTASEVAQLQLELAKLGFDPKQIQAATDSILDLSTAVDADLGESAKVVGASLRAFGLDAEETGRVTDVMALSFSRSSLDINKFSTAMSTVAPVAKAFGFSIEETTALLAQLTDAGFDASAAGTATRNILLNLADTNGELAKRLGGSVDNMEDLLLGLEKLNDEGVDLNETLQLTDKRSVAAFNRFINATDQTRALTKELENAGGAAARMARIMRDNLSGDADKAKSAIQGLFINIGNRLNPAMRSLTKRFTSFVGKLNEFTKIKASEELKLEQVQLNLLVDATTNANNTQESRIRLLDDLQAKYPDFLENLDKETVTNEELRDRLIEVNSEYLKKINLLAQQELIQENAKKQVKLILEEKELIKDISALEKLRNEIGFVAFQRRTEQSRQLVVYNQNLFENRKEQKALAEELQEDIKILEDLQKAIAGTTEATEENTDTFVEATKVAIGYTEAIEKLKSVASEGITIKLGTEFPDQRTDNQKFIDDLVNRNAKKSIDANNVLIKQAEDRQKAIEDLETKHYDSLLGIAFNFANRKAAQDETLSNEELAKVLEDNANTEAAYQQLADTLRDIGNQILQSRLDNLDREIDAKNQQINELNQSLNRELALLQAGAANEYNTEKEKLTKLQKERDKDIQERRKIQKQQEAINTLIQISELATAIAQIINSAVGELGWVGVIAGLAAAAAAVIGFATIKSDAASAASAEDGAMFTGKGTHVEKGKRHSQGGNKYSAVEFEKDEIHSIFSRKASSRYAPEIEAFTDAANSGTLSKDQMQMYNYGLSQLTPNSTIINNNYSELLSELITLNRSFESQKTPLYDKNGKLRLFDNFGIMKKMSI